jgi:hypothetical protein
MPKSKVKDRSSEELRRLLGKVEERLQFHHQSCMSLAAVRGTILTELLRRESRFGSKH